MLLAHLHDVPAAVGFPQNADLLFRRVPFAFHGPGFFLKPRTNIATGPDFRGSPQLYNLFISGNTYNTPVHAFETRGVALGSWYSVGYLDVGIFETQLEKPLI